AGRGESTRSMCECPAEEPFSLEGVPVRWIDRWFEWILIGFDAVAQFQPRPLVLVASRLQHRDDLASLRDRDGRAGVMDLIDQLQAFGFEFRGRDSLHLTSLHDH